MKGIIVYKGKYGATQDYANWAAKNLHLPVAAAGNTIMHNLYQYDYVLIGSSVYVGKLLINDWLKDHQELLVNKKLFLFIVCGSANEKEKHAKIISDNIPAALQNSVTVFFLPGRVVINRLSWRDRLLLKVAAMAEKDPAKKRELTQGIDGVKEGNLGPLLMAVRQLTPVSVA